MNNIQDANLSEFAFLYDLILGLFNNAQIMSIRVASKDSMINK
jgi:hypothetical protein